MAVDDAEADDEPELDDEPQAARPIDIETIDTADRAKDLERMFMELTFSIMVTGL